MAFCSDTEMEHSTTYVIDRVSLCQAFFYIVFCTAGNEKVLSKLVVFVLKAEWVSFSIFMKDSSLYGLWVFCVFVLC